MIFIVFDCLKEPKINTATERLLFFLSFFFFDRLQLDDRCASDPYNSMYALYPFASRRLHYTVFQEILRSNGDHVAVHIMTLPRQGPRLLTAIVVACNTLGFLQQIHSLRILEHEKQGNGTEYDPDQLQ